MPWTYVFDLSEEFTSRINSMRGHYNHSKTISRVETMDFTGDKGFAIRG
jgi:hypothetical protein